MGKGIIGTVTMFGTVAIAATVAFMGIDFLLSGKRTLGAGFLLLAVVMVLVEEYVITPGDVPAKVAEEAAGAVVDVDDEDGGDGETQH